MKKIYNFLINTIKKALHFYYNFLFVIRAFKRNKGYVLVWIYPHIGDMFIALPYISQYKKNHNVKIALVGNVKYKSMYEKFFGIDKYYLLSEKNVYRFCKNNNNLLGKHYLCNKIRKGKFISNQPLFYQKKYPYELASDVLDYTKKFIYKLDEKIKIEYPIISKPKKLSNQKYVIIAPYAKSAQSIKISEYNELVCILKKRGYVVYSNVFGEEKEIDETIRLECSLEALASYTMCSRAFISIRSGVCDMIAASTNTDLFVFFNGYSTFASLKGYRDNGIFEYYDDLGEFLNQVIIELK